MNYFPALKDLVEALGYKDLEEKDYLLRTLKDDVFWFTTLGGGLALLLAYLLLTNLVNLILPLPSFLFSISFLIIPVLGVWTFQRLHAWHKHACKVRGNEAHRLLHASSVLKQLVVAYQKAEYYDELEELEDSYLQELRHLRRRGIARENLT